MSSFSDNVGTDLATHTKSAVRQVVDNPWVARLARLGYAVQGLLYGAIGLLAVEAALGVRRAPEDVDGVIALIGRQPYGQALLLIIAIVMTCEYASSLVRKWIQ